MNRGLIVKLIAFGYIGQALWNAAIFLTPIFSSSSPFVLNLTAILVGALDLWAAIYLLQLSDFGRKYAMVLCALQLMYNLFLGVWLARLGSWNLAIHFFNRHIYESSSLYLYVAMLIAWSSIPLAVIVFLGQPATKALFKTDRD